MNFPILTARVQHENDVPLARQRARQICALFGLDGIGQTRLATAVSEIARNAVAFGSAGQLEFLVEINPAASMLVAKIEDRGPGIANLDALLGGHAGGARAPALGIIGSRRLVDRFDIATSAAGTSVRLAMALPDAGPPINAKRVSQLVNELTKLRPGDTLQELEQQNREILQTLDELRHHQQKLRLADQRKDEFLAMLAHELRNPLAAILNGVEYLRMHGSGASLDAVNGIGNSAVDPQSGIDSRAAWQHVEDMMGRQTRQLSRLIDDLLDVSRITQGTINIRPQPIEVSQLIPLAVEMNEALIAARGQQLTVTLPPQPIWIDADLTRMTQILGNLLNNAAKYTGPGGQIWLSTALEDGTAVLRVRDTGMGISADMLPRVFDLFTRADDAVHSPEAGLGIGLTIVQRMVELHGGSVSVRSAGIGAGSEFVVRVPVIAAPAAAPVAAVSDGVSAGQPNGALAGNGSARAIGGGSLNSPPTTSAPMEILVVDDNVDSAESLAMLLRLFGHETRVAHDGPAALRAASELLPRAVILDIGMPGMDGFEVARRLRAEYADTGLLLIGLSGYGDEESGRKAKLAGFDHRLVKPLDFDALQLLLN